MTKQQPPANFLKLFCKWHASLFLLNISRNFAPDFSSTFIFLAIADSVSFHFLLHSSVIHLAPHAASSGRSRWHSVRIRALWLVVWTPILWTFVETFRMNYVFTDAWLWRNCFCFNIFIGVNNDHDLLLLFMRGWSWHLSPSQGINYTCTTTFLHFHPLLCSLAWYSIVSVLNADVGVNFTFYSTFCSKTSDNTFPSFYDENWEWHESFRDSGTSRTLRKDTSRPIYRTVTVRRAMLQSL